LGLYGNEQAVERRPAAGCQRQLVIDSFAVATTTSGRVLAKKTRCCRQAFEAFNIPAERAASSVQCSFATQNYGIRTSSNSGHVYVNDKHFCQ
jgi:hypothetical protein